MTAIDGVATFTNLYIILGPLEPFGGTFDLVATSAGLVSTATNKINVKR
jgi:hypothetical protein